jgi:hypothetical protein
MADYVCNLCAENGKHFTAPADQIGAELMKAHLQESHPKGGADRG